MSGVYTFGEVIKVLGITSSELNELMGSQKLIPVRHEGRLKFKQEDVEKLKNNAHMVSHSQSEEGEAFYSWNEVLIKLQIEKEELQRFIEDGDIQAHKDGENIKFSCTEIDSFVNSIMDQGTIVMSNTDLPVLVEEYDVIPTKIPTPTPIIPQIETYSLERTLRELQTEEVHLQKLVDEGEVETVSKNGEICYSKKDIDKRRQNLQVEATIVMRQQDIIVEEDDEPLEAIVISAPKSQILRSGNEPEKKRVDVANLYNEVDSIDITESQVEPMVILPEEVKLPLIPMTKKEFGKSFYTLSEVAQELTLDANALLDLLAKNKIKTYRMNKLKNIKRSDLLRLRSMQFVQNSMQMIKIEEGKETGFAKETNLIMEDIENIEEVSVAVPVADITKEISPSKNKYENTIVIPLLDEEDDIVTRVPVRKKALVPPQPQTKDSSEYYSFVEALNVLQMEQEGLDDLINKRNLNYCLISGTKSLLKNEVDEYKTNKMVEPTIMMDESGDDVLEEDDDEGLFFIS